MNPRAASSNVVPLFAMSERDDDALMVLARDHRQAFDVLITRHQHTLLRIASKYLGSVAAARDACQAAFYEVYRDRSRYQARGRFGHYLRRVVLNHCHMTARRRKLSDALPAEVTVSPAQPDELILAEERRRLVEASLQTLSERLREVVVLRYAGEHKLEEIADILELPVGTVKRRLFDAMQKLAVTMEGALP